MVVIILHGWGSNSRKWEMVKKSLEKDGFLVFIPDLPGFGNNPPPKKIFDLKDYALWLNDFTKQKNISEFFLIGHSFGGKIAILFANLFPEKLRGLILIAPPVLRKKEKKFLKFLAKIGKRVFSFPFLKRFYFSVQKIFYYFFVRKTDYLKAKGVMKEIFLKVIKKDLTPYLDQIKIPTFIIWGEKDKIVSPKEGLLIKEKIQNSSLKFITGAGHSLNIEAPELLTKAIKKFLIAKVS